MDNAEMYAYEPITRESFDVILGDIIEYEGLVLLSIPGIYKILSEYFNDQILETYDEDNEHYLEFDTVVEMFEDDIKSSVEEQYGRGDSIAIREAFNDYTDMLCKDGKISDWAYSNWPNPY